ncbi:MAG: CBS domain-containing protein [Gammaproteobacteria bacterium]|nr:CBS domain-containing protein [Gammaproteobacteria bacterium]
MNRPELQPQDFKHALQELDSYIDVTLEDLMQIHQMAEKHAQLRQAEQLKVSDIMTKNVATVHPETSLRDAARLLLERRISGLPVTDAQDRLVGIVTEADFLCAMGIACHHPAHNLWQTLEAMFRHQHTRSEHVGTVADIMVRQPIHLQAEHTLHDVIETMKRHHIKRVVVTDAQQHVEGIITRSNLVQVLLQRML